MSKVFWISGNIVERKAMFEKLKKTFVGWKLEFLQDQIPYQRFEVEVLNQSCFDENRLLILNSLPVPQSTKATMLNHLKKLLKAIPDGMAICFYGIPAEDEIAISNYVKEIGRYFNANSKLDPNEAAAWVVDRFKDDNKTIAIEDAQHLVDTCGYDESSISINVLRLAIRKIGDFMGRRRSVTREDIVANIFPSENFVMWAIFDALDTKSFDSCQNIFHRMIQNCNGNVVEAINFLFNVVLPRYRMLFFLKEELSKRNVTKAESADRGTREQIAVLAAEMLKIKSSGTNWQMTLNVDTDDSGASKAAWSPRSIDGALNAKFGRRAAVDFYSRKELVRIMTCAQDCMVEMRSRSSDSELQLLADVFFLSVCSPVDDSKLETLRNAHVA